MAKKKSTTKTQTPGKPIGLTRLALEYLLRVAINSRDVNEAERISFVKLLEQLKD